MVEWRDIIHTGNSYDGLYEISKDGDVRRKESGRELSKYKRNGKGSDYVALTNVNSKTSSVRVGLLHHLTFGSNNIANNNDEQWKSIKGYENIYQVSNKGRVRSLDRKIWQNNPLTGNYQRFMKGRILSLGRTNGNGYHIVQIRDGCDDMSIGNDYIHTLVATHFIPNPEDKPTVNHIDGDKSNNNVENLEWATQSEQMKHAFDNGLHHPPIPEKGEKNSRATLTDYEAKKVYNLAMQGEYTYTQIGKKFNTTKAVVSSIKRKKSWLHIHES